MQNFINNRVFPPAAVATFQVPLDLHPKKVTVLKVTGVELVTLSYF